MLVLSLIAYGIIGLIAGFLGGLLSISGGLITVPCLFIIFKLLNFPSIYLMQLAIGTSLAAMVFNAISATFTHHREKDINWKLVKKMMLGLILGCIAGAFLGYLLPGYFLKIIFALFAIGYGVYFYQNNKISHGEHRELPEKSTLNGIGFGAGAVSDLLGIGGGTMMVPIFTAFKVPIKISIGTSAALGFMISLVGAIAYLIFGLGETYYDYTIGYIYLPAFVMMTITSVIAAPFGAHLSHNIASIKLRKYFAIALVALGLALLLR